MLYDAVLALVVYTEASHSSYENVRRVTHHKARNTTEPGTKHTYKMQLVYV